MLLELSRAASGKVTLARFLDKVTLPEAALLHSNSILKVRFFGTPCISNHILGWGQKNVAISNFAYVCGLCWARHQK